MAKCLGIYIEDDVIKYAKVDKNKDVLKVEASNVVFYESIDLFRVIEKIVQETYSSKDPIAINISNEIYNYFEVFSALKLADKKATIKTEFEYLCGERGYNQESLESRFILRDSKENPEKVRAIHVSTNKENLHRRIQNFNGYKVTSATPISSSIYNLVDPFSKDENVIIVNIEKETKITTVIGGEIYNINVINEGMGEILGNINQVENSFQKSYECCKNTTIYTQDSQDLQTIDDNEHLDDIIPTLYKIASETKKILDSTIIPISKIYITGLATVINNVDLYFQEYIQGAKCELLKPFFMENTSIKFPIKDYIEVNSAIALALEGFGYGLKELNFKTQESEAFSTDSIKNFFSGFTNWRALSTTLDKTFLRVSVALIVGIIAYIAISDVIITQIDEKTEEIAINSAEVAEKISLIEAETTEITSAAAAYESLISALTTSSDDSDSDTTVRIIEKDAIPNLLNKIVYVIPSEVQLISIQNTESTHIVIEAQAEKYEQLGYFKAALTTKSILLNVKSDSGIKEEGIVTITIEGDLP